jgi:hypothetical protein
MKRFLFVLVNIFAANISLAQLPSAKLVKYLGYSGYQPEFSQIYTQLEDASWKHPKRRFYYDPEYGHAFLYQNARLFFDETNRLYAIKYTGKMPYGFRDSMRPFGVKFKMWLKRIDKVKKQTKDGYILDFKYDGKFLQELVVTANKQMKFERKKTDFVTYKNIKFPSVEAIVKYKENVWYGFPYLTTINGKCKAGNCENGTGKMTWQNKVLYPGLTTFSGTFENGEPRQGGIVYTDSDLGIVKIQKIKIRNGFAYGQAIVILEQGDTSNVTYRNSEPIWTSGMRRKPSSFHYQGAITRGFHPEVDERGAVLTYKNGSVYKIKKIGEGKYSGTINYGNGITYSGGLNKFFFRYGYGVMYDNNRGGKFSGDFSNRSVFKENWYYNDGTYRQGWFSPDSGFDGEVKTYYNSLVSFYTVTGKFVNDKPEGKHVLYAHARAHIVSTGYYKKGILINGVDVYTDPVHGLVAVKKEEEAQKNAFMDEYKRVMADYKKDGIRAEGNIQTYNPSTSTFYKQSNRVITFFVFDPFSKSSEYILEVSASEKGYNVYSYPTIRLQPMAGHPNTYVSQHSIGTKSKTEVTCVLRQVDPQNNKFKAALILISSK